MNYFFSGGLSAPGYWVLTTREFAAFCKVTQRTVWNWIKMGIPCRRLGDKVNAKIMIPLVDGLKWVARKKKSGAVR